MYNFFFGGKIIYTFFVKEKKEMHAHDPLYKKKKLLIV